MNFLFDPVKFEGKALLWTHSNKTNTPYPGYYHWHQCMELLFVHEGEGTVIVDQHTYEIRRGMLFLFQPFQLHKIFANVTEQTPYTRSIAFFDPAQAADSLRSFSLRHSLFLKLWQGGGLSPAFDLSSAVERVEHTLSSYQDMSLSGRGQEAEEITLLLLQLLGCIHAVHGEHLDHNPLSAAQMRPLRYSEQIMRWIEDHFAEEVSLDQLAETLHLSKFYVSRVFHSETGSNITDYLTAYRIKQACRLLLSTTQSVEHVGIQVGYPNVSYFINMFKKVVGTTPLKYRQRHVGNGMGSAY